MIEQAMNYPTERFTNPSQNITKYFSAEALAEVDKDFLELFLSMFSEARRLAVEECGQNVDFQINRGAWQRGKWYVLKQHEHSGRHSTIISILRWANTLISAIAGYALSEIKNATWLIIFVACVMTWAIAFVIQEKLEAGR